MYIYIYIYIYMYVYISIYIYCPNRLEVQPTFMLLYVFCCDSFVYHAIGTSLMPFVRCVSLGGEKGDRSS